MKKELNRLIQFLESKDHLIDKLNLTDEQKAELKDFFRAHPNFENKIDWNNKSLQYKDFEDVLNLEGNTKSSQKKYGLSGKAQIEDLVEGTDYDIVAEDDDFVLYYIKTFKGSEVLAKPTTPPEGVTGKWCIAGKNYSPGTRDQHWKKYHEDKILFFFYFLKKEKKKYALAYHTTLSGVRRNHKVRRLIKAFDENDYQVNLVWMGSEDLPPELKTLDKAIDLIDKFMRFPDEKLFDKLSPTMPELVKSLAEGKEFESFCDFDYFGQVQVRLLPRQDISYPFDLRLDDAQTKFRDMIKELTFPREVILPDRETNEPDSFPIRVIAPAAFKKCKNLQTIYNFDTVKIIKDHAFYECKSLTWLSFIGITEIGTYAFAHSGLIQINLSNSQLKLETGAFYECENLKSVRLPWSLSGIPRITFGNCVNLKTVKINHMDNGPMKKAAPYKGSVGPHAFEICHKLETVELPYGITDIEEYAFYRCSRLQTLTVPSTFKKIQPNAFEFCPPFKFIIGGRKREIYGLEHLPQGTEIIWDKTVE